MIRVTIEIGDSAFFGSGETIEEAYEKAMSNYELSLIPTKGKGMWEQPEQYTR